MMREEPFRGYAYVLYRTGDRDEARTEARRLAREHAASVYVDFVSPRDVFIPGFGRKGDVIVWTRPSGPHDDPHESEILDLRHVPQPFSLVIEPHHAMGTPEERSIRDALDSDDLFPMLRDFYASTGKRRQAWMRALDTFSFRQLDDLARASREYGTAAGVELKDAIVDILDMRRSQGRGRPR